MLRCILSVDLVCSDAKATNDTQIFCLFENSGGKHRLRPNPNDMDISEAQSTSLVFAKLVIGPTVSSGSIRPQAMKSSSFPPDSPAGSRCHGLSDSRFLEVRY